MKVRLDKLLRFWIDVECAQCSAKHRSSSRSRLINKILCKYEEAGEAMRYLNSKGQIAWKATPSMIQKLADQEREVTDDFKD